MLLLYGSEVIVWRKKERSRIRAMEMGNLRGLLGIEKMDRVQNARIRQLGREMKRMNERIDERVL